MRIATYNVEWFSSLFNSNNKLFNDNGWSGRYNVTVWCFRRWMPMR